MDNDQRNSVHSDTHQVNCELLCGVRSTSQCRGAVHKEGGAGLRGNARTTRGSEQCIRVCALRPAVCTLLAAMCWYRAAQRAACSSRRAAACARSQACRASHGNDWHQAGFDQTVHVIERATHDIELKGCASPSPFDQLDTY